MMGGSSNDSVHWMQGKRSRVNEVAGLKSFSDQKSFEAKAFAGAEGAGSLPIGPAADAGREARLGGRDLGLGASPMGSEMSGLGRQVSPLGDRQFQAQRDVIGSKAMQRTIPPQIIELPEQAAKPAFTEDEVKKLLGRESGKAR